MSAATILPTAAIRLHLLGTPRVFAGGRELRFPDRRCVAMLAVVAGDGSVPRERVAGLLWDAEGDTDARRNLRRELHRMRDAGFDGVLDSSGPARLPVGEQPRRHDLHFHCAPPTG